MKRATLKDNKVSDYKVGALYKMTVNTIYYMFNSSAYFADKHHFTEVKDSNFSYVALNKLNKDDIFLYVGEVIGPQKVNGMIGRPAMNNLFLYKILFKDTVYWAQLDLYKFIEL
jgi:hypothetical protein